MIMRDKESGMKRNYGKRLLFFFFFAVLVAGMCGCGEEAKERKKIKDLETTVLKEGEVPTELLTKIKERWQEPFTMTYETDGYFYIARGYGTQPTSGYSIRVLEVYETEDGILFLSELIGPGREEAVLQIETYPYIVIKMQSIGKELIFR